MYLLNSKGSSIIQALITSAVVGIVMYNVSAFVTKTAYQNSSQVKKLNAQVAGDSFLALTSDSKLCMASQIKFASGTPITSSNDAVTLASTASGLPIQFTMQFPGWNSPRTVPSLVPSENEIPSMGLSIVSAKIRILDPDTDVRNIVNELDKSAKFIRAEVQLQFKDKSLLVSSNLPAYKSIMNIEVDDATGVINGCSSSMSPETVCKSYGGIYRPSEIPVCQFMPIDMNACRDKGEYIKDFDDALGGQPICEKFHAECAEGYVLRGVSSAGDAFCEPITVPKAPFVSEFVIHPNTSVDILLVIDNSGSMETENKKLSQKFSGFTDLLNSKGIDWQACYTTTGINKTFNDRLPFENGRAKDWMSNVPALVTGLGKVYGVDNSLAASFTRSLGQFTGGGSGDEQGIKAINYALDAESSAVCFRDGVTLATIIVSDEDEHSCGERCDPASANGGPDVLPTQIPHGNLNKRAKSEYAKQFKTFDALNKWENLVARLSAPGPLQRNFVAHSLIIKPGDVACHAENDRQAPAFYGNTYAALSGATGGIVGSVCAADYASELAGMAFATAAALQSVTLECTPTSIISVEATHDDGTVIAPFNYTTSGNKLLYTTALIDKDKIKVTYNCP
jgi:hypothetical protein